MYRTLYRTLSRIAPMTAALALTPVVVVPVHAQTGEADVVAVVDAFHHSLATGDSATALSLLADDVTILEGGAVEDKEHYRSGHLAGDMRYAAAVPRERGDVQVRVVGDVAWAWSTNVARGTMGDREVNSQGAELVVLGRVDGRWLIRAIHWSSRQLRRP
jgi:ketosteroid isomerase-like protein